MLIRKHTNYRFNIILTTHFSVGIGYNIYLFSLNNHTHQQSHALLPYHTPGLDSCVSLPKPHVYTLNKLRLGSGLGGIYHRGVLIRKHTNYRFNIILTTHFSVGIGNNIYLFSLNNHTHQQSHALLPYHTPGLDSCVSLPKPHVYTLNKLRLGGG